MNWEGIHRILFRVSVGFLLFSAYMLLWIYIPETTVILSSIVFITSFIGMMWMVGHIGITVVKLLGDEKIRGENDGSI